MSRKILKKHLLFAVGAAVVTSVAVPTIISSAKLNSEIAPQADAAVALSTLFPSTVNAGEFGVIKPTLNSVLTRLKNSNNAFTFNPNLIQQDIDYDINYPNTTSATITATSQNAEYTGSATISFSTNLNKYALSEFFANGTDISDNGVYEGFSPN
jgi:hypothetical protein